MDIVDYDIIKNTSGKTLEYLIFIKVVDETNGSAKLSYKSLNNMIYKVSDGFCITNRKGTPLVIKEDLKSCQEYLHEEHSKSYNVINPLILDSSSET